MLRIVSYYTPSHAEMFERFVQSRAIGFDDRMFTPCEQTCQTGDFKSDGWNACMLDKLATLMAVPADGRPTLYVDADVCLFPTLVGWCRWRADHLADDEVAFSDDRVQWCAGIMLFRATRRVQQFWRTIADLAMAWDLPDQDAIHQLRCQAESRRGRLPITPSVLPGDVFCNWATVNADVPQPWNGEPFQVPRTCLAWHANWTIGVANKMAMLEHASRSETSAEPSPAA